jgi:hypothetical protein
MVWAVPTRPGPMANVTAEAACGAPNPSQAVCCLRPATPDARCCDQI